jgi:signal transduction histidine kinase
MSMDITDITAHNVPGAEQRSTPSRGRTQRLRPIAGWLGVTLFALVLAAGAALISLHPPTAHLWKLISYLAICGVIALVVGTLARRLATIPRLNSVRLQLAIPAVLTALVIAVTTVLLAYGMFLSVEDSALLLIFLAFAAIIALALASSIAAELGRTIADIEAGARRVATGEYGFRVKPCHISTARELMQLAHWFNQMAANVEDAFARRQAAESERRHVIAALSHDLRTPLSSTRAMLEAIDDGVVSDPQTVRRYQRVMRAELVHLSMLMDDLFDLARLDAGALPLACEPLCLDDLLSDVVAAFRERADQVGIRLAVGAEDPLPVVSIDPRQIYRTLTNLVQNALQYVPPDGVVLLQACSQMTHDGRQEVLVQVIDTGVGIAAGDLPHIFERAYRGEASRRREAMSAVVPGDSGPGAGLGLAIARGIVELHGGRIWATSPLPAEMCTLVRSLATARGQGIGEKGASGDRPSLPGTVISVTLPSVATTCSVPPSLPFR